MKQKSALNKIQQLQKIKYHWYSYVARGGFSSPTTYVGSLEQGGLKHWTLFLQIGRQYLLDHPKDRYLLEGFIPSGMIKILTGE